MGNTNIRNFVIIAHVSHGKSTLADRFLELTKTIHKEKMRPQYLDMMDLEREKGITIKMQPVRMTYILNSKSYILNLIDTPGHIDFSYEVSRSLAAVEGAILLVDATKGIQAQTVANLDLARKQGLQIIPVVNKIDLPQARVEETAKAISHLLGINKDEVFKISAKYGTNVEKVLEAVIKKFPPPKREIKKPFRSLIFDSKYDSYKGVIAFVRVVDGEIEKGERIYLMATKTSGEIREIGIFKPELTPKNELKAGEIGYLATGIKEPGQVRVGDTIISSKFKGSPPGSSSLRSVQQSSKLPEALPGYREPKPMVFASLYPQDPDEFDLLKESLSKLKLTDPAISFEPEFKEALGRGFRCGFLGSFHAEIISERLRREFGLNLVVSIPQVVYKVIDKKNKELLIKSIAQWPEIFQIKEVQEPWIKLEVMTPTEFLGETIKVLETLSGKHLETLPFGQDRFLLIYEAPLREIIAGFYDKLKGSTQGYASMNYEILGDLPADLVKLEILIAGRRQEPFSKIVPKKRAFKEGKRLLKRLKELLPPQLFSVALQAKVGSKIIARETIKAKRKDVTAFLYGGDYTRKRKLLEKQKRGKRRLKEGGRVRIPSKVYLEMFKAK